MWQRDCGIVNESTTLRTKPGYIKSVFLILFPRQHKAFNKSQSAHHHCTVCWCSSADLLEANKGATTVWYNENYSAQWRTDYQDYGSSLGYPRSAAALGVEAVAGEFTTNLRISEKKYALSNKPTEYTILVPRHWVKETYRTSGQGLLINKHIDIVDKSFSPLGRRSVFSKRESQHLCKWKLLSRHAKAKRGTSKWRKLEAVFEWKFDLLVRAQS